MTSGLLARLDEAPEAYAAFFRRHVDDVLACSDDPVVAAEVCAEAFAAVLDGARRFDPARGSAAAWLHALARRELARGRVGDRARRRLGMAPLAPGDAFADQLEEELVAAAQFRAARHALRARPAPQGALRRRFAAPRRRTPAVVLIAVAAAVALAALAFGGGGDPPGRAAPPAPPPGGFALALPPMQGPTPCGRPKRVRIPATGAFAAFALLARPQRLRDPLQRIPARALPIGDYDPQAVRRPSAVQLASEVRVVPTTAVVRGRCGSDGGPGLCLVVDERALRCFTTTEARAGRGLALTPLGTVVGIVPDGIDRVTVAGAPADVVENVYEAWPGRSVGDRVGVAFSRAGDRSCERTVAPALLERVAALRAPAGAAAAGRRGRRAAQLPLVARRDRRGWGAALGKGRRRGVLGRPDRARRRRRLRPGRPRLRRRRPDGRRARRAVRAVRRHGRAVAVRAAAAAGTPPSTARCRTT